MLLIRVLISLDAQPGHLPAFDDPFFTHNADIIFGVAGGRAGAASNTAIKIDRHCPAVFFVIMTLVWMHKKSAGYPIGGALEFDRLIEKRYLELGGRINYKSKVVKVITENDTATGIILENNDVHDSDIVISAADGYHTIFDMLSGKYVDKKVNDYYNRYKPFPSYVQVSLGVSRTFDDEPHTVILTSDEPLTIDQNTTNDEIWVRLFNHDKTLAPEGKTVITALLPTYDYEYWENLKKRDAVEYKRQKKRIADEIVQILEKRYGNVQSNVEMIDVSTPSTVIRYTNNWKGSFEGWLMIPGIGFSSMPKSLAGLQSFYMCGQWVEPGGGVPAAMMSGRNVAQIICKKDKKKFVTQRVRR